MIDFFVQNVTLILLSGFYLIMNAALIVDGKYRNIESMFILMAGNTFIGVQFHLASPIGDVRIRIKNEDGNDINRDIVTFSPASPYTVIGEITPEILQIS